MISASKSLAVALWAGLLIAGCGGGDEDDQSDVQALPVEAQRPEPPKMPRQPVARPLPVSPMQAR